MEKHKISVIVPVYNDAKHLGLCLTSIFNSDYKDFEVIVVNDGSTDDSLEVAKKFPCKIIDLKKNAGVANARNNGANAAEGTILIFFDSDIIIEKNTLSKFVEVHKKPNVKVCQCQVDPKSLAGGIAPDLMALSWNYMIKQMGKFSTHVSTMAFSIKKEVFDEIGQFNTSFKSAGGEEFEMGEVLRKHNYNIYSNQTFSVKHYFHGFWPRCRTLYRRSFVYGKIFLERNFEFDRGHGTLREGFSSMLSVLGIVMLATAIILLSLSIFIPLFISMTIKTLIVFVLTVILSVFIDKGQNSFIIRERGTLFFLKSIPINYIWYFVMGLGVAKAIIFYCKNKIFSPLTQFKFLFSETPYVIFSATALCNARCKHCFNWKKILNPNVKKELTLEEMEKISKKFGKIKYLTYTGGEPILKKEITEITQLFYNNNNLEMLNLISNGFATEMIVTKVKKILRACPNLILTVSFSIDGIGQQHDNIRNFPGGFNRLLESIKEIKKLQTNHKNLKIMAVTTYSKFNQDNIFEIIDYITGKIQIEMFLNYVRGTTYYKEAKEINVDNYEKAVEKIMQINERNAKRGIIQQALRALNNLSYRLTIRTIKEKKRVIPCQVGTKLLEIGEDGAIFPCELLNMTFGNIRDYDYDIHKVLKSDKTKEFFKFLKQEKCYCTWECAMKSNMVFSIAQYPGIFKEWIKLFFIK